MVVACRWDVDSANSYTQAPCNFWLFANKKKSGKRFTDIRDIKSSMTMSLRGTPENDFQDPFRQ
jgi:hypothetical protein